MDVPTVDIVVGIAAGILLLCALLDLFAEDSVGVEPVLMLLLLPVALISGDVPDFSGDGPLIGRYRRPVLFWMLFGAKLAAGLFLALPLAARWWNAA